MRPLFHALAAGLLAAAAPASAGVIFDQIPANPFPYGAIESQDFEAAYDQFDSATIDDFSLSAATDLTSIDAVLYQWNGGHVTGIGSYTVNVYSSVAQAGTSIIGDIFSQTVQASAVTTNLLSGSYYTVHVPFTALLGSGTYWISLVSNYPAEGGGQIGVINTGPGGNGYFVNPNGGFGAAVTLLSNYGGGAPAYRLNGDPAALPTPEPATWVMTLGGFGAVGSALRARRKRTLSAV
jgi:hypothetical protein